MTMLYKEDWDEAKDRLVQWWNGAYFGRCALGVKAPKEQPPDIPPPPPAQTPEQRWLDLDWISQRMAHILSHTYFGGEATPVWHAGYSGISCIAAYLGCTPQIDMNTGWRTPIITDPHHIDFGHLAMDPCCDEYRFTVRMLRRAVAESRDKAIPSIGAFGGCGDTLATVRGTEQLLVDCIERPDDVRAAEDHMMDMWCDHFDWRFEMVDGPLYGSTCYFELWSPGKFYGIHNDFSYNIGPRMFRELFLPMIRRQTEFLDHAVYHVDGVNAFRHVEALCELPNLQALQILPGAGQPSPLYYMDTLKQVQAAGKNLHITIGPEEVAKALSTLSARGLYINTRTETEAEARELLRMCEHWSVDRS